MLELKKETWFISDPHLFHDKIIEYCDRPNNYHELIINSWNQLVLPKDDIVCLGDMFLAKSNKYLTAKEQFLDILPLLRGNKYLILGNHNKKKFLESCGFTILIDRPKKYYVWSNSKYSLNNLTIFFSHRPLYLKEIYLNHKRGIFNVHGHRHEKEDISPAHINISVEQTMYRPIRFGEILEEIKRRMNK